MEKASLKTKALEMTNKIELLDAKAVKQLYAEKLSIASVRELMRSEDFPSVKIGTRIYTSNEACERYFACMGIEWLLSRDDDSQDV